MVVHDKMEKERINLKSKFNFQERKKYFIYGSILGIIIGVGNSPWNQPILIQTHIGLFISHMIIYTLWGAISMSNLFYYVIVDKMDPWSAAFRGMKWVAVGGVILLIMNNYGFAFWGR
jgi:hypothetical protein